ncbi:2-keto-4-pentenoate hydratase [Neobacillus niacini]|uniref:2-keto-4-pentenoate hydratase n=1 Tax=Neobacillus niacini TaxID=86668 RepID=UPI002781A614|nr:2-keto-4-pentenoate hydratase [Neobacillus niacini]MDQ1002208.1 2-keto-4-pentenoate hydratase [Neobacillus niacini]
MNGNNHNQISEIANYLWQAELGGEEVTKITEIFDNVTLETAYQVQLVNINKKVTNGDKIVGKKIGLTSKAMQDLLQVDQPDYGHLLASMSVQNKGLISVNQVLQPKVEGEIAFVLKKDLTGPEVTVEDVLEATDYILPALEIVSSRIKDWKISLNDTVADNASSGLFVLGEQPIPVEKVNLKTIEMEFFKNKSLVNTGVGTAVLGNPAYCVAWLANKLSEFGISLKKGEIILSGALSAAVDAVEGDLFTARFTHLGEVSVNFSE